MIKKLLHRFFDLKDRLYEKNIKSGWVLTKKKEPSSRKALCLITQLLIFLFCPAYPAGVSAYPRVVPATWIWMPVSSYSPGSVRGSYHG